MTDEKKKGKTHTILPVTHALAYMLFFQQQKELNPKLTTQEFDEILINRQKSILADLKSRAVNSGDDIVWGTREKS